MRRRAALIALGMVTGWLVLATPATAGLADRIGATFVLMAGDFVKAAAPVEGVVVSTEGDRLYIDVGQTAGAQAGQELTVFRKGEPFRHPFTGKVLGRYEEMLGYAQIRIVEKEFSQALFIPLPDRPRPQEEDGVRISRGRIRIAITPLLDLTNSKADVRRVPYLLGSTLERSKRFQVVDPLTVSDVFAGGGLSVGEVLARPERAIRVAKNLDVTGWLVPVLLERHGEIYLDATWVSAITGTALFSRRRPLLSSSVAEEQRFPWEPRPED